MLLLEHKQHLQSYDTQSSMQREIFSFKRIRCLRTTTKGHFWSPLKQLVPHQILTAAYWQLLLIFLFRDSLFYFCLSNVCEICIVYVSVVKSFCVHTNIYTLRHLLGKKQLKVRGCLYYFIEFLLFSLSWKKKKQHETGSKCYNVVY